ncbi:BrnT family toxin [Mesorhizobium sp. BAC0120]|uniref:BrnT family toxin n=1 Tax=Mesorhizobium sp. BAC0120 TaxID=3090670 RepID=UPI00298C5A25|nr:BrnT family toxin [Mesorhizobium sp. BAC0120]MDW6024382.1 BrnT family toxin [Mesorhizobium sp. BAC0120]
MILEWDENKRRQVIKERGVDVVYAALIFEGEVLTRVDDREDYGEVRLISLGMVDDEYFVVVHTERNGSTRLITAWKGGRHERAQYEASIARRDQTDEGER